YIHHSPGSVAGTSRPRTSAVTTSARVPATKFITVAASGEPATAPVRAFAAYWNPVRSPATSGSTAGPRSDSQGRSPPREPDTDSATATRTTTAPTTRVPVGPPRKVCANPIAPAS